MGGLICLIGTYCVLNNIKINIYNLITQTINKKKLFAWSCLVVYWMGGCDI